MAVLGPLLPAVTTAIAGASILRSRKVEKTAKQSQARQEEQIGRQRQIEEAALAEEEDEIGRRRLLAKQGGRRSLIRTSEKGTGLRTTTG